MFIINYLCIICHRILYSYGYFLRGTLKLAVMFLVPHFPPTDLHYTNSTPVETPVWQFGGGMGGGILWHVGTCAVSAAALVRFFADDLTPYRSFGRSSSRCPWSNHSAPNVPMFNGSFDQSVQLILSLYSIRPKDYTTPL